MPKGDGAFRLPDLEFRVPATVGRRGTCAGSIRPCCHGWSGAQVRCALMGAPNGARRAGLEGAKSACATGQSPSSVLDNITDITLSSLTSGAQIAAQPDLG